MNTPRRLLIALALLLLTLLCTGLTLTMPLGEGYDENTHLKYIAFLAINQRLPDQRVEDVRAAQHPPAYHATLSVLYSFLRDAGRHLPPNEGQAPVHFPYERDVTLPLDTRVVDLHAYAARRATSPAADEELPQDTILVGDYYLLRATGLLFLLALAGIVFWSLDKAFADRRGLAALGAAASLLVPLVPGTFATVGNDQFAALFGAAGFGVLLVATSRGRGHAIRPLLLSSALFGIGFLSKLWVLSPFVAAAWLLTFHETTAWRRRLRSILVLGSGPLLIAGWWIVHRTLEAGSPLGAGLQVSRWPGYLRVPSPDFPLGYLAEAAKVIPTYVSVLGFSELSPGDAWTTLAVAWPLLLVGSVLACLLVRGSSSRDKTLVMAFLLGALVHFASLMAFSNRYAGAHGRYFLSLLLPATAALVAGLPSLTGRRSRGVLAAFTMFMAVGGLLLLHTAAVPSYWTDHRWERMPDAVRYVDLGSALPERDVGIVGGSHVHVPTWHLPTAAGRARASMSPDQPFVTTFRDLDAADFLLLSPRLMPIGSVDGNSARSAVDLDVSEQWIAGPLSIFIGTGWVSFAVPQDAVKNGELAVGASRSEGTLGTVAEFLLRRLPLQFEGVHRQEDGHRVAQFFSEAPDRLPPLRVALQSGQQIGPDSPLQATPDGRVRAVLEEPPAGVGRQTLLLYGPEAPVVDMKLQPDKTDEALTLLAPDSPGLLVIDTGSVPVGAVISRFRARWIPPGDSTIHLLDGTGADACEDFLLQSPFVPVELVDRHWRARTEARQEGDGRVFIQKGERSGELDRVQIRQPILWTIPLDETN